MSLTPNLVKHVFEKGHGPHKNLTMIQTKKGQTKLWAPLGPPAAVKAPAGLWRFWGTSTTKRPQSNIRSFIIIHLLHHHHQQQHWLTSVNVFLSSYGKDCRSFLVMIHVFLNSLRTSENRFTNWNHHAISHVDTLMHRDTLVILVIIVIGRK